MDKLYRYTKECLYSGNCKLVQNLLLPDVLLLFC